MSRRIHRAIESPEYHVIMHSEEIASQSFADHAPDIIGSVVTVESTVDDVPNTNFPNASSTHANLDLVGSENVESPGFSLLEGFSCDARPGTSELIGAANVNNLPGPLKKAGLILGRAPVLASRKKNKMTNKTPWNGHNGVITGRRTLRRTILLNEELGHKNVPPNFLFNVPGDPNQMSVKSAPQLHTEAIVELNPLNTEMRRLRKGFAPHFKKALVKGHRAKPETERMVCRVFNFIKSRKHLFPKEDLRGLVCQACGISRSSLYHILKRKRKERMGQRRVCNGFDELSSVLTELDQTAKQPVFILFTGSKDQSGHSWCPDCVKADPVIEQAVDDGLTDAATFITCFVGPREYWKDPNNPFRTHKELKITSVPTIIKWNAPHIRLVESQCWDKSLVQMMLEEE